jgi:methyl-accepting chemotaxis protein
MSRDMKSRLEIKYMVFVTAFIFTGIILWSVILSLFESWNLFLWIVIAPIFTASLAFSCWFLFRRFIFHPFRSLEKTVQSMARGDMSLHIPVENDGEVGRLADLVRTSIRSLVNIIQSIKNSSLHSFAVGERVKNELGKISESTKLASESITNIASSIEEMNSATSEISINTDALAASAEKTVTSMEEMVSSIGHVANNAQELSTAVDSTSVSIEELSATIKEVAQKAEDLTAASEETLAAIEEISSSVKEVESSAKESATLSEKVKTDASTFGLAAVEKTIEGMQNIKSSVEKTADVMMKLGGRSNEIGKILNVIDDITDQTTLLALNAAILAAQAGEHGKGFSVVADEIKDLAERTFFSTQEIASLIQAVQKEVKDAIEAMNDGLSSVEIGFKVASDAGNALSKIVESSKQSAAMSFSIERSTTEQAKAALLVTGAMEKVKNMVAQVAKATSEQSKGAGLITKATEKVRDVASRVKLATEEQQLSAKFMSESMEQISEKSRQIAKAINEQRTGSSQIFMAVEKMKDVPMSNIRTISDINQSLKDLLKNSDTINKQIDGLRIIPEETAGSDFSPDSRGSDIRSSGASPGDSTVSHHENTKKG